MMTASLCMTSSWRHCKYFFWAWKFWIFNSMQLQSFCLQKAVQQQLLIKVRLLCIVNFLQLFYSN